MKPASCRAATPDDCAPGAQRVCSVLLNAVKSTVTVTPDLPEHGPAVPTAAFTVTAGLSAVEPTTALVSDALVDRGHFVVGTADDSDDGAKGRDFSAAAGTDCTVANRLTSRLPPGKKYAPREPAGSEQPSWKLASAPTAVPGRMWSAMSAWMTSAVESGSDDWPGAATKGYPPSDDCGVQQRADGA